MNIEEKVGYPQGVMPEEGTLEHKDWLKKTIIDTWNLYKTQVDSIITESYLAQMHLYQDLYHEVWIGTYKR